MAATEKILVEKPNNTDDWPRIETQNFTLTSRLRSLNQSIACIQRDSRQLSSSCHQPPYEDRCSICPEGIPDPTYWYLFVFSKKFCEVSPIDIYLNY